MCLFSTITFAIEIMPKVELDLFCNELDAKSYYADGTLDNVKLDGEGLRLRLRHI